MESSLQRGGTIAVWLSPWIRARFLFLLIWALEMNILLKWVQYIKQIRMQIFFIARPAIGSGYGTYYMYLRIVGHLLPRTTRTLKSMAACLL